MAVIDFASTVRVENNFTESKETTDQVPKYGNQDDTAVVAWMTVEHEDDTENTVDNEHDGEHSFTCAVVDVCTT